MAREHQFLPFVLLVRSCLCAGTRNEIPEWKSGECESYDDWCGWCQLYCPSSSQGATPSPLVDDVPHVANAASAAYWSLLSIYQKEVMWFLYGIATDPIRRLLWASWTMLTGWLAMRLSMWWKESRSAQMFRRTVRILKFHLLAQAETASDLMARWYVRNGHRVWRVDGQVWTTAPGGWAPEFCTSRDLDGTETTWRLAARGPQSRRQAIRTPSGDLLLDDFAAHVRQHMTLALPDGDTEPEQPDCRAEPSVAEQPDCHEEPDGSSA